eukprot:CAMPEP_0183752384 /NCGR_PEP_ID=MMETSP0739-20130205/2325_1 /TAXON_ID=385413 /ORGANISM="Thalassiosira miniscula, Strain CCMP1093" /LENGTH=208 /DNA_ID=CAMNT_0025988743 /DNA_START=134 /DNA_END=760 /DNA_ORIENTATION=-
MPMRLNAASFAFAMAILFSPATLGLSIVEDADAHQDHYDANVALIDVTHYPATASVNATPSAAPSLVAHSMVHSNKISYSCVELPVATDQEVIFLRPPSRAEVEASVEVDAAAHIVIIDALTLSEEGDFSTTAEEEEVMAMTEENEDLKCCKQYEAYASGDSERATENKSISYDQNDKFQERQSTAMPADDDITKHNFVQGGGECIAC